MGSSVPRLYKLRYLEVALHLIAEGAASFDRIRLALVSYAANHRADDFLVLPNAHDPYAFWSPTQEALAELMRLNFVEQAPLPSERKYVDAHRDSGYTLTGDGERAIGSLCSSDPKDRAEFLDMLSVALVDAHHGFADLLSIVERYPLCIPEYTIERISTLTDKSQGTVHLATDAIARMTEHWPNDTEVPSSNVLALTINDALERRFPRSRAALPSQKDVLDTVNDAILAFVARSRNIRLDAISFNVCLSWAGQLALLEQSRYVEAWRGRTVWATAHVDEHLIRRRGFQEANDEGVKRLENAFKMIADAMPEARASGYLPIHRVRATAAFGARLNLRLIDMLLGKILSGQTTTPSLSSNCLGEWNTTSPLRAGVHISRKALF